MTRAGDFQSPPGAWVTRVVLELLSATDGDWESPAREKEKPGRGGTEKRDRVPG